MKTQNEKQRFLRAKIVIAFQDEFGRVPTEDGIDQVFHLTRHVEGRLGLHYKRREKKNSGQLAIF